MFELDEPETKVVRELDDKEDKNMHRILILNQTIFYPCAGGQANDTGMMIFELQSGEKVQYNVINVTKVGPCVLHYLDRVFDLKADQIAKIKLVVDRERRLQLMAHHTGAHILSAACRRVLGPHVWQAGAKKTTEFATLDITHYSSESYEQQREIEKECNRIIRSNTPIIKQNLPKNEAEKKYGFTLYQGGVVPGSSVRCVSIEGIDNEACCGTHFSTTASVGMIKIQKTNRISDGVVRIQFVAGEAALKYDDVEQEIIESLKKSWGVELGQIQQTASKFFDGYKQNEKLVNQL